MNLLANIKPERIENVLAHTNARLEQWYENVKAEYGVDGIASAQLIGEDIVILYSENGVKAKYIVDFWQDKEISYAFDVWSSLADIENDEIK